MDIHCPWWLNLRWMAAIAAGAGLASAFPKPGLAGLAWIAPGLLLASAAGAAPRLAFQLGYAGGLAFWLTSLYWLLFIPFPLGAITGWLALCAYLALYPACWVWLCWRMVPDLDAGPSQPPAAWIAKLDQLGWLRRCIWTLSCSLSWVALEMLRGWLMTGFPWNHLGASQYRMLPLTQLASVTGV
jgi:apolipoprotein N-acyltransferase